MIGEKIWKDHHHYTLEDIHYLMKFKTDFWITTEKDAVKLRHFPQTFSSIWVLEMTLIPDPKWHQFFIDFLDKKGLQRPKESSQF